MTDSDKNATILRKRDEAMQFEIDTKKQRIITTDDQYDRSISINSPVSRAQEQAFAA